MKKTFALLMSILSLTLLFVMSCSKKDSGTGVPAEPTIASFTPTSGLIGTTVTITGTNLTNGTVKFNGTTATVTAATATSITCTVPVGTTSGILAVTTTTGTATSSAPFTVTTAVAGTPTITSFTPGSGLIGATVTITGTNLTGGTVKFNGTVAATTSISATSITCSVPTGATTGTISVTNTGGTATSATSFTVTPAVGAAPTITSFTPNSGLVGATVTITGTNLTGATVSFNGTAATTTAVSATSITCTVPTGATTGNIAVTTTGGTATSTSAFTVTTAGAVGFLYVPGGYQGWAPATAPHINEVASQPKKFEGFYNITGTDLFFKFTTGPDWNHINYGTSGAQLFDTAGAAAGMSVPSVGYYYITGDFNPSVNGWTATKTTWSILGDATPGGWTTDTPLTYDPTSQTWKVTVNLIKAGSFKFRANDLWIIDFGVNASGGLAFADNPFLGFDATVQNITVPADGNYTLTLDLHTSGSYSYSAVKN